MLADYISPGDRVELKATGKIWMDNDARTRQIYMSKVMDITSDDRIEVLMPYERGRLVLLPVDGEYSLCFYSTKGLFQCYSRIVDRYRSDNMYVLVLDLTSQLQKLQRKETLFRGGGGDAFLQCIYADVTIDAQECKIFSENFTNIQKSISEQRMSVAGVDEDEEALDLIKFQNAYNLASKCISVFSEIYDRLILNTGV